MKHKRIAITGMGVISTAGCKLDTFWKTLYKGENTYKNIPEYLNNKNYRYTVGARIENSCLENALDIDLSNRYGRASQYAMYATKEALQHAGLDINSLPDGRTAISIGSTMGEIQVEEEITIKRNSSDLKSVSPNLLRRYRSDRIGQAIRETIKVSGPTYTTPAACAAGNYAISLSLQLIQNDICDIAIVGGVDVFSRVAFIGFQRLLSLSPDVCRPFSINRKGLIVGEGCGIVILEKIESAKARGAKIWGEILGIGLSSDAYHMTAPHPEGTGASIAMKKALDEAEIFPTDVDYISAHGTGTVTNDKIEVKALIKIFGKNSIPPVSSIKSMLGHSMGAAGLLELISSLQMMEYNTILPTANYIDKDDECPIDCVPNIAREKKLRCFVSNSYAFGGQNSSIVVIRN